jgi:Spy/CpxP family protein refolding chaperone
VRATSNVRARLAHELDKEKDLLQLLEQATAPAGAGPGGGGANAQRVSLTTAQRQKLEYIRRVAAILEMRMLHLAELIFLFHAA